MRPEEWGAFEARAREGYAATLATPDGTTECAAERRAETEHARLLPHGIDTAGHSFFVIEADGERAGTIWFAEHEDDGVRFAYLYDLDVDEGRRGSGIGMAALRALEAEVRRRGLAWIDLNVSGSNAVARGLYAKLDYRETFVRMRKLVR